LVSIPLAPVAWQDFRATHRDAWTLSRVTGHDREYGRNPYLGYDGSGEPLFDAPGEDARLPAMERIIAITGRTQTLALVRSAVAGAGVFTIVVDGRPLVVWHRAGQASALDDARVARGRDIGTVAVLVPTVGGRRLSFTRAGDGFVDMQTGTSWNVLGQATRGPLVGRQFGGVPVRRYVLVHLGRVPSRHPAEPMIR
jgi:Protein of unknown function (DUF3179)